jgi:ubiquitin-protein ligase
MQGHLPPGISIVKAEDFEEWQMDIRVLDSNPLYQNEAYRLKFTFGSKYPIGESSLSIERRILFRQTSILALGWQVSPIYKQ